MKTSAHDKKLNVMTTGVNENVEMTCDVRRASIALLNVLRSTISHAAEKTDVNIETKDNEEYIRICITFYNDDSHGAGEELRYADHLMALMDGELTYTRNENGVPSVIAVEFPKELKRIKNDAGKTNREGINTIQLDSGKEEGEKLDEMAGFDLSHLTVIVVEDDPELRELLVSSLTSVFRRVLEASNGKDALTLIKNSNPDLIITEARLPQMTGIELCRIIKKKKEYSHIPVIMLSTLL